MTVWVEIKGPAVFYSCGDSLSAKRVLIVYDPDPIYNLDEQICRMVAMSLAAEGMLVNVKTVACAENSKKAEYDLYVFCSNTYNWQPDWAISGFISRTDIKNKKVICITLGSGSTETSKQKLEKLVEEKQGLIIASRSLWLLRPNDDSSMNESNVSVALSEAYQWTHTVISSSDFMK